MGTVSDGDLSLTAWREGPSLYAATSDGFGAIPQLSIPNTLGVAWYATGRSYLVLSTTGKAYPLTMTDRTSLTVQ
jgi:hypothetical protein